ncbi:MAG TPA: DUF4389 domain-containing protein [Gaiellaceae bacterium]|nr:DUF4389 domain-containing protein [Gaiellaceae bacterium]
MSERPVRLVVSDDLRRSRVTVAFRLLLAIPHLFWLSLWSYGIGFTSIAQWAITLVRGRPAGPLQSFHVAFVRYLTHLGAYLTIAANPFPGFLGEPGYPVDVELDPAPRQGRLGVAFRLLLALPALLMLSVLVGIPFLTVGIVGAVAFLGWFAALVRGSMPLGLRNLAAYGVRYAAEVYAYLLFVTPTYPSSDPTLPDRAGRAPMLPIRLVVDDDRRRSRLTTFFRLFLAVPHIVWLFLWAVLASLAAIVQWLVTLVRGRPAMPLFRFLAAYVRYQTHLGAYVWLVGNPFPGFVGARGYPIDVEIDASGRQSRWVTGFRLLLALPAFILNSALNSLLLTVGVAGWFAALAIGRMPLGLRNAGVHALHYNAQVNAYALLLTDRYPFSGPPVEEPVAPTLFDAWA